MKMRTFSILFLLVIFLSACSNSGSTGGGAESGGDLRFMAAAQTGAWYPLAVGITEMMKNNIDEVEQVSIEPGGGISNVVGVNNGRAQLGFSQAASLVDGIYGNEPFDEVQENVNHVLSLFPHKSHIIVTEESGINSVEDIRGKRINVGQNGLLTEVVARRILELYDMDYSDMDSVQNLSFADSVEQMKDGRIDALFWTVPVPFAVLTDLSQSINMKLLPLPEDKINELISQNSGFIKSTIEAGTYNGVDYDVPTIQSPLVLIAHKDASEKLVYETTKIIVENLEELGNINAAIKDLEVSDLAIDIGVEVHPGAQKYFEEQNLN